MTDTTLPPEVAEAIDYMDRCGVARAAQGGWSIIRAHLHRLAEENARLRPMLTARSQEMLRLVSESGELKTRAEKAEARVQELERENGLLVRGHKVALSAWRDAEAELAAIKKRIAEAAVTRLTWGDFNRGLSVDDERHEQWEWEKLLDEKTVALLPLDDEAKS